MLKTKIVKADTVTSLIACAPALRLVVLANKVLTVTEPGFVWWGIHAVVAYRDPGVGAVIAPIVHQASPVKCLCVNQLPRQPVLFVKVMGTVAALVLVLIMAVAAS